MNTLVFILCSQGVGSEGNSPRIYKLSSGTKRDRMCMWYIGTCCPVSETHSKHIKQQTWLEI